VPRNKGLEEGRAVPSRTMASNSARAMLSLSGASRRGRQATGGPGVVRDHVGVTKVARSDIQHFTFTTQLYLINDSNIDHWLHKTVEISLLICLTSITTYTGNW
jgi:hypothetical protein